MKIQLILRASALCLLVSSSLTAEAQTLTAYQNAVNAVTPAAISNYHFANAVTNSGTQGGSLSTSGSTAFVTDSYSNASQAIQFVNSGSSSAFRSNIDLGSAGTVMFMFKTPSAEALSDQYLMHDDNSTAGSILRLYLQSDGLSNNTSNLRLQAANLSASNITTVGTNQWYFFAMTWDVAGGSLSYYVGADGGNSLTTLSPSISTSSSVGDVAATFFLGNFSNTASSALAGGAIDEFVVFNSALSGSTINGIYATTVPEPSEVALVGIGFLLILSKVRTAQRRAKLG